MATGNSINANQSGIQSYDGAGTWSGRVITGGTGVTVTNGDGVSGNPTISANGSLTWTDVTGTTQAMSVFNGYIADNATLVTFSLPATANLGDVIYIYGKAAGGWKVTQGANQQIVNGILSSTVGTAGFIASTKPSDSVEMRCITAGTSTVWSIKPNGSITTS